jgi:hypothetical protein
VDEGTVDHWLFGFRLKSYTNPSDAITYEATDNVFDGCLIEGANRAYYEENLSDRNRGVVYARGGSATGIQLRPDSSSQVVDGDSFVNGYLIQSADADISIGALSARVQLITGARGANRSITFSQLPITVRGREFHFTNTTTGGFTTTITQLGAGGAGTKALAAGQWADVMWNGTTLELMRFGSL